MIPFGYVLDDTVLIELGRFDLDLHRFILMLDQGRVRTGVPAIALATAEAMLSPDQRRLIRGMMEALENIHLEVIASAAEAERLSEVLAQMEQPPDMAAAHTIAVAQHLDWPILTMSTPRWEAVKAHLPWRLELVHIHDLDD
ncbi:hypothetical protein Sru01_25700 [Sphaerisporangium rufum]|uniref:PIN domain-containing protein n=1 Tax=Sphaerisporangium rufum TaxID=1381558 RepID=A0A919R208_9ACTN|nr:hypothetical protein [Sphaerisporangium rufum]GII77588.1 hypothetical protein Sru01_25700 [Sphaerisporangium rufum]